MKKILTFVFLTVAFFFPPKARAIDTLNFFLPPNAPQVHISTGEIFQSISEGSGNFIIRKSANPAYYERFRYDGSYIYHLEDTTWATENGNVKCANGQEAYFNLFDGTFGTNGNVCPDYNRLKPQPGMKWVARQMEVGQCTNSTGTVVGFSKQSNECCDTPFTGSGGHTMCLIHHGCIKFPNGIYSDDGIALKITAGPGTGETFYYDKKVGWVGFSREGGADCAYVTDPLPHNPSLTNCLEVQCGGVSGQPLIVQPKTATICTDFKISKTEVSETVTETEETPESDQRVQALEGEGAEGLAIGELEMKEGTMMSLDWMAKNLAHAADRYLPEELRRTLSIDETPLEVSTAKHFVGEPGKNQQTIPQTKVTFLPSLTKSILLSYVLCGASGTCEAPDNLSLKIAQPLPEEPSPESLCSTRKPVEDTYLKELIALQKKFSVSAFITVAVQTFTRTVERAGKTITQIITRTEKTAEVPVRTRVPAPILNLNSRNEFNFSTNFLPEDVLPQDDKLLVSNKSENTRYEISDGWRANGQEKKLHQELQEAQFTHCFRTASWLPEVLPDQQQDFLKVNYYDPICPSNNFVDY